MYILIVKHHNLSKTHYPVISEEEIVEHNKEVEEYDGDPILPEQLEPLENLSYEDVKKLNGSHMIFGAVECYEQDDGYSTHLYNRNTSTYSFKHT